MMVQSCASAVVVEVRCPRVYCDVLGICLRQFMLGPLHDDRTSTFPDDSSSMETENSTATFIVDISCCRWRLDRRTEPMLLRLGHRRRNNR